MISLTNTTFRQGINTAIPGERKSGHLLADHVASSGVWRVVNAGGVIDTSAGGIATLKADGFPDFATIGGNLGFGLMLDNPELGEQYGSAIEAGEFRIEHTGATARFLTPADASPGYMGGTVNSSNASLTMQDVDPSQGDVFAVLVTADGLTSLSVYRDGEEPASNSATPFRKKELALLGSFLTPASGHIRHMMTAGIYTEDLGKFEGAAELTQFGWEIPETLPAGSPHHKDKASDLRAYIDDTALFGKSGWPLEDIVAHANRLGRPLMLSIPVGYLTDGNEDKLDSVLQYVNDNIALHASVEYGSENWNDEFTPYRIIGRDRGELSREQYVASRYDKLIQRARVIDPSVSKLRVYVGGQTGFNTFLKGVLENMSEVCQSAGTAPYVSPRAEDLDYWKANSIIPTGEELLDSCIANLAFLQSAVQRQVDAITLYEARLGVTVERIAYEGGYAYYAPTPYLASQRQVLTNPNGKLKDLYRGLALLCQAVGYDEVVWYVAVNRMLIGGTASIFGHGQTFSRLLRTDPSFGNGTQTVADQHEAKPQVIREWLPQFQLAPSYSEEGGSVVFELTSGESGKVVPFSGIVPMSGDDVSDIDFPWDTISLGATAPPLPPGVTFDSDPLSPFVGEFDIDGPAMSPNEVLWMGDVVLTSLLSGNVGKVSVTLNFTGSTAIEDPSWGDNSIEGNVGIFRMRAANAPEQIDDYQAVGGSLPVGWSLTPGTGLLSGSATTPGSYSIEVQGTGPGGITNPVSVTFEIGAATPSNLAYPNPGPFILADGGSLVPGVPTFDDGSGGERFTIAPPLPAGMEFSVNTGEITKYPKHPFPQTTFIINLTDAAGRAAGVAPAITTLQMTSTVTPIGGGRISRKERVKGEGPTRVGPTVIVDSGFFDRAFDGE